MLTKQDLKSIAQLLKIQKEEILDEVDTRMDKNLDKRFKIQTEELLKGIDQFIQDNLIPLITKKELFTLRNTQITLQ